MRDAGAYVMATILPGCRPADNPRKYGGAHDTADADSGGDHTNGWGFSAIRVKRDCSTTPAAVIFHQLVPEFVMRRMAAWGLISHFVCAWIGR